MQKYAIFTHEGAQTTSRGWTRRGTERTRVERRSSLVEWRNRLHI